MEEEKPSVLKIIFSFILSIAYIIIGYVISYSHPTIAQVAKIFGIVEFVITLAYIIVKTTTWPNQIQVKVKEYFLLTLEIAYTLLIISVIAFTIRFFVFQPFLVNGESMEPNFKDGEYLIVNEISYKIGKAPQRGDVIVLKYPKDPRENFIKRIIGLPGETVKIHDKKIFIAQNNSSEIPLEENYIPYTEKIESDMNQEWLLGKDDFFVVGDNRLPNRSSDSRSWGLLPRKNIIGKVWVVFWPPSEMKFITHAKYNL
ncbi:signal peptidase I [bacterium CG06_land_8_20_14_3_00_33_50]|nr:MAG: signal peptidase I [bacterium CG10_big_fil_rev_8_21_14_0_10_33_18]PIU77158.1 MAG: signal peptidase I [bacterium CG06_land_8_20_14_3_00_33_50]PIW81379.1 MAG: signal peptidase I [bacterium CG_4_8_14_3_um_filter_33_28]PIY85178.1 MAG: signal peptidase I [bacterium CG_4_10_14_0_8_um_filter_33_57]